MKRWASLLGPLGLVAIGFGLISIFLMLFGAPTDPYWIWGNLVIGFILLSIALVASLDSWRERLRTGEARRASRYGTAAVASTVLGIAILGLLGFLASRHSVRFDWSEGGVHSLSDQTRKVLEGLTQDVDVTAFASAGEIQPVRELLDRYAYASPKFKVEFADPTARPDLVEKLGVAPDKLGKGLVRVAIGKDAVELSELDEEKITNALVKLTRQSTKKVYFLEGHGERPVTGEGAEGKEGFSRAADALRNENYQIESLVLGQKGDVPEDANVVIVAGPTRTLPEEEHAALERYLERGGALLVLVDPRSRTDLGADLERWGVSLGDDVVVDRMQGFFGRAATPFAGEYGAHPITAGLREVTLFHVARSVRPTEAARSRYTEIVKTSPDSWAERDLEAFFGQGKSELGEADLKGPVSLAVAGKPVVKGANEAPAPPPGHPEVDADRKSQAGPRLVVFGDSDFAANQLLDSYRNRDLFVNSANWLLGDVEAISVRPNQSRPSRVELSTEQLSNIRYLALFVLPEAIAFLGVFAWWSRRRAPGR
jgi:ABC-type uncharacterized transport system involved in gliding motility auxiliary subunit